MQLSKQTKLMHLFTHTENPLLLAIESIEKGRPVRALTKTQALAHVGVAANVHATWRHGTEITPERAKQVFMDALHYLDALVASQRGTARFEQALYEDTRDGLRAFAEVYARGGEIHEAARALRLPTIKCQQIVDELVYGHGPVLPAAFYPAESASRIAEDDFRGVEGQYTVWVKRGRDLWLQAPLHVRYLLNLGSGRFIRCKLNFPILPDGADANREGKGYWEYDGFVVLRSGRMHWHFEKRQRDRNDYFTFITQRQPVDGLDHPVYVGQYLTTGQDIFQSIVSGPILLRLQFRDDPKEDPYQLRYLKAMRGDACVLSGRAATREPQVLWQHYAPEHGGRSLFPDDGSGRPPSGNGRKLSTGETRKGSTTRGISARRRASAPTKP